MHMPCLLYTSKITGDKQNIESGFSSSGDAAGTDGKIYIFEMQPFEDEIGSRRDYAASAAALGSTSVTIPLNLGTCLLYTSGSEGWMEMKKMGRKWPP